MSIVNKDISNLQKQFINNKKSFYPFIEHIRFPKYKALERDARINFTFPITLLVGQNGGNKTSILQALYGSPVGKSIGDYWFSTDVDRITEGKGIDRQCFIYGYHHEKAKKIVEVLKTRIHKDMNPDYWEPARPQPGYDMEKLDDFTKYGSNSKTRWDVMSKDVVYCDCKEYVSAYDLFFYHYDFQRTKTQKSKQDFIRQRSKPLAKSLIENQQSKIYYKKEMISSNLVISQDVVQVVSHIMGEEYSDIQILTHNFYSKSSGNKAAKTIWISKNGKTYSEAFAGTGEARIILLVNDILNASKNSLILIDEPEISLHPSAIFRLKEFIIEQTLRKHHQVVITTHSTQLVKDFPKEAIKVVSKSGDTIQISENVDFRDAFYELGDSYTSKKLLYVEDRLAKNIVDHVIELLGGEYIKNNVEVRYLPGGADQIINKNIITAASEQQPNNYYWLDGDMKPTSMNNEICKSYYFENGTISSSKIPDGDNKNLDKIINEIVGRKIADSIKVSGANGKSNENELIQKRRSFIDYWSTHVSYLPCRTPEEVLLELKGVKLPEGGNAKEYFEDLAKEALGTENIDSNDILHEQRRALGLLKKDDKLFIDIKEMLDWIVN